MDALEILTQCQSNGVEMQLEGGQLRVLGPQEALDKLRPQILAHKPELLVLMGDDASKSRRKRQADRALKVSYTLVTSAGQLSVVVDALGRNTLVALDVETTGLDPLIDRPRLLQLGFPDGTIYIIDLWAVPDIAAIGNALAHMTVIGHNLQFDLAFLKHHYGITVGHAHCTMTAARLIDAGIHCGHQFDGYFSLPAVANRYLGATLDKTLQTSDWSAVLTADQLLYAARDVLYLFDLDDTLGQQLRDLELTDVYELESALIPVAVDMYLTGLPVDPQRWQDYLTSQEDAFKRYGRQLADELPGVNPMSPPQLLPALRKLGCDVTSTGADVLAPYCTIPVVDHLLNYRSLRVFARTLGPTVARAIALHGDNRVHTPIFLLGAPTGRVSCSKPNLLAVPKDSAVRHCIAATPGTKLVSADYAAIELRVLAEYTQDRRLLHVFRSGGDPHRTTASLLLNKPEGQVTKDERQCAKVVNFGFIFGMGAKTFVKYAYAKYGLKLTLSEAERFLRGYRAAYVGVAAWQRRIGRLRAPSIRTASGRLRRFEDPDDSYCASLNTPVQGTAADGMKKALILLHQELPRFGAKLLLAVHDEVLVEAPPEAAEEVKAVVVSCMKRGMEAFVKSVPIEVEASVRTTWSETDVEAQ
ncbi:MAG: DNA polymerase [Polyangia bacterium]